jgi:tRNA threonylcarbamoyl adenosine modification protein (Sua5/YciO/YrdC/YwlC family)
VTPAEALRAGQVVVLPTDTVYGVATLPAFTARLFEVKARPTEVALPVLAADVDQALSLAAEVSPVARRLAERFWPGGLTLVLARATHVDWDLGGTDTATIGVRVPDHDVPRRLAGELGPLVTTSANRHGRPTPETAAGVAAELGQGLLVVDGGRCAGAPSTVVAVTGDEWRVLREGRIPADALG